MLKQNFLMKKSFFVCVLCPGASSVFVYKLCVFERKKKSFLFLPAARVCIVLALIMGMFTRVGIAS